VIQEIKINKIMRKNEMIFIVGPISSQYQAAKSEREFTALVGRWKLIKDPPKAFVGNHFFATHNDDASTMAQITYIILQANLIVTMPGFMKCKRAMEVVRMADTMKKELVFFENIQWEKDFENGEPVNWWNKLIQFSDAKLGPITTNPMKR